MKGGLFFSEGDARKSRRRRETTANEMLAGINSEFHLYDSPPLQRLIRQVGNKKSDEEYYDYEDEAVVGTEPEVLEDDVVRRTTTPGNAPPPPTQATVLQNESTSQSSSPVSDGGKVPSVPPTKLPVPPPPPSSPPTISPGELYLPPGYNRLEIPKLRIGKTNSSLRHYMKKCDGVT